jgi:hypothetical protein
VYHAKNRNVLILATMNYDVLINGKTARAGTKIVVARTSQVAMAGKQKNRSVMESIRWLATTNFLDNLPVTTNSNTIGLR